MRHAANKLENLVGDTSQANSTAPLHILDIQNRKFWYLHRGLLAEHSKAQHSVQSMADTGVQLWSNTGIKQLLFMTDICMGGAKCEVYSISKTVASNLTKKGVLFAVSI